jgi:molybdopterin-guanine dinucleotide biosynthesis protein A
MTVGVILAGGLSSRFAGEDKALATIGGVPMTRAVANQLVPIVEHIVVNVRRSQQPLLEPHLTNISCPVQFAIDKHTGAGPVAGLDTALKNVSKEKVIITACDMPLIRTVTLSALVGWFNRSNYSGFSHGIDCVLPLLDGQIQPLCGIYSVEALNTAINMLGDPRNRSCNEVIEGLEVLSVPQHRLPGDQYVFTNINSKNDLKNAQVALQKRRNESLPSLGNEL